MTSIPTLKQLYESIKTDLEGEFGTKILTFGKSFLRALALVQAAKLKLYYLAIGMIQKNLFADTADPEERGGMLERIGRIKLGRNRYAATAGQYEVQISGTVGGKLPAGATLKANDDSASPGKLYVLDNAYIFSPSANTITVRALEAGLDSQLTEGDGLSITAPYAGIEKRCVVVREAIKPLVAESVEDYRRKVIDSYRLEAQGGAPGDYILWGQEAQGVKRIYPYAKTNASGEINLFVEATIDDSIDGAGTPSASLLERVASVVIEDPDTTKSIYERARLPMGVFDIHVLPVVVRFVHVTVANFYGIDEQIKTTLFSALKSEVDNIRPFIGGATALESQNDVLDVNKIIATILNARPGSRFGAVEIKVDNSFTSSFQFVNGDIPSLLSLDFL